MSGFFSAVGSFISMLFWLVISVAVIVAVIAFFGYNKLRQLSESVKEKWSNVTVVQRKQVSLINQLLDVVKGYQESEKLVVLKISEDVSNTATVAQMYQQSGTVLSTVSGMAQKFPELKANQQYQRLIDSIQSCEKELEGARQLFNSTVKVYNVQRSSIPHVFYSTHLGFKAATYLEFSGGDQVTDMGSLASFSSDADGERLNQLLSVAGSKALELSSRAIDSGRNITAKAVEGGKALAETAQVKIRDMSDRSEHTNAPPPPPPPKPAAATEISYYFLDGNHEAQGPLKLSEIKARIAAGELADGVLLAAVGSTEWLPFTSL
jgi:LemA protein